MVTPVLRQILFPVPKAASFTTLDPATKAANGTLSNGNLTWTCNSGVNASARSIASFGSVKKKFEITFTSVGASGGTVGVGLSTMPTSSGMFFGEDRSRDVGISLAGGIGVGTGNLGSAFAVAGDTIAVEVDGSTGDMWIVQNNNTRQGPYNTNSGTGTIPLGGPYFFGISDDDPATSWTVNFGATSFVRTNGGGFTGL